MARVTDDGWEVNWFQISWSGANNVNLNSGGNKKERERNKEGKERKEGNKVNLRGKKG
jgi:hypothetical protein